MVPTTFKDFLGEPSQFRLRLPNRVFHMRVFTLGDSKWILDKFGPTFDLNNVLPNDLCKIIFQLLENEDKEFFKAKDVELYNDDGESITKRMGGGELMFWQVSGLDEIESLKKALFRSISGSRAVTLIEEEEKKKEQILALQTGPKFSTSSLTNMDGPQMKSSSAHSKKSNTGLKQSRNDKRRN